MTTDCFLPGFAPAVDKGAPSRPDPPAPCEAAVGHRGFPVTSPAGKHVHRNPDRPPHFDAFGYRVKTFTRGLSPARRREIALHPRFHRIP